MPHRTLWWISLPLVMLLTSCSSFNYNVPPAETGLIEEAGEIQLVGNRGEEGVSAGIAFGFLELSDLETNSVWDMAHLREVDSAITPGESRYRVRRLLYGILQGYDHQPAATNPREQREYNAGVGMNWTMARRDTAGIHPLLGWAGNLHYSSSIGLGYGSITSESSRWDRFNHTIHTVKADYFRPWLQGQFTISRDLFSGVAINIGSAGRLSVPILTDVITTDTALGHSTILFEFSYLARITLFDFLAIEYQGGLELFGSILFNSGWAYDYNALGLRLIL